MHTTVKIRFQLQIFVILVLIFSTSQRLFAQYGIVNKYGLSVIKNGKSFNASANLDSNKRIMDIKKIIPTIIFDLRYATTNNFMHTKLYPAITTSYLRLPAATALHKIQQQLSKVGLGIKIFDAYRPYSITEKMWQLIKDDRYVADPKKGSGHNRCIAVDVTLIDLKTKEELPMGTGFDNFSDTAHQTFTALPSNILYNRSVLKNVMEKYGFKSLETEWWHYSLPNAENFEILDFSFKTLQKLTR